MPRIMQNAIFSALVVTTLFTSGANAGEAEAILRQAEPLAAAELQDHARKEREFEARVAQTIQRIGAAFVLPCTTELIKRGVERNTAVQRCLAARDSDWLMNCVMYGGSGIGYPRYALGGTSAEAAAMFGRVCVLTFVERGGY